MTTVSIVTSDARAYRLASIDMLRGLVLVIMVLDHVRDYLMTSASFDPMAGRNIDLPLYFTRWITHFCAPVFVFLAGTSAGLMTARRPPRVLARFLLTRGVWLIVVEWFVMATAFTFAPWGIPEIGGRVLVGMQVIWVIGASFIVLAAAQFLGRPACLAIGAAIIAGHNLLDPIWPATDLMTPTGPWWAPLHSQSAAIIGPFFVVFLYPLLPWIGVLLAGFGASRVFEDAPARRDTRLVGWGIGLTVAFVVLRLAGIYGDPNPWERHASVVATLLDVLNTTKYPPSLLFLLMTLGPAAILCGRADRIPASIRAPLVVFGRVPFAFYVVHFYVVHLLAVALGTAQGFDPRQLLTFVFYFPKGYGIGLPGVYAAWALVVLGLYPFCRWMADLKARRRDWWLSYL